MKRFEYEMLAFHVDANTVLLHICTIPALTLVNYHLTYDSDKKVCNSHDFLTEWHFIFQHKGTGENSVTILNKQGFVDFSTITSCISVRHCSVVPSVLTCLILNLRKSFSFVVAYEHIFGGTVFSQAGRSGDETENVSFSAKPSKQPYRAKTLIIPEAIR